MNECGSEKVSHTGSCIYPINWNIVKGAGMNNWPFKESENLAVFTSKDIVSQQEWVYYVSHDDEDGAWQFHPFSGFTEEKDACLGSISTGVK
jgi:hypothetical protein